MEERLLIQQKPRSVDGMTNRLKTVYPLKLRFVGVYLSQALSQDVHQRKGTKAHNDYYPHLKWGLLLNDKNWPTEGMDSFL